MSSPTPLVHLNPAAGPGDQLGTTGWFDLSPYVQGFTTSRGRDFELDRMEAGTATIVLDNTTGIIDPLNVDSPLYPYVVPLRPIRICQGYVYEVEADQPWAYWRLPGTDDHMGHADSTGIDTTIVATPVQPSVTETVSFNGGPTSIASVVDTSGFVVPAVAPMSFEAWFSATSTSSGDTRVIASMPGNFGIAQIGSTITAALLEDIGSPALTCTTSIDAATVYHLAMTWDMADLRLYIDGQLATSANVADLTGTLGPPFESQSLFLGAAFADGSDPDVLPFVGTINETAFYNYCLGSDRITAHHHAGVNGITESCLFAGYIEGWPQTWATNYETQTTIDATDAFTILARTAMLGAYDVNVAVNSPTAFYKLDEDSGIIATDASGHGYDGTYTSSTTSRSTDPLVVDGGKAIAFVDASSDDASLLTVPPAAAIPNNIADDGTYTGTEFTIEAWIKPTVASDGVIFMQDSATLYTDDSANTFTNGFVMLRMVSGSNTVIFATHPTDVARASFAIETVDPLTLGKTYHLVAVCSNLSGTPTGAIFVDGAPVATVDSASLGFARNTDATNDITIGAPTKLDSSWTLASFVGAIDNVAIYPAALTTDNISTHHAQGLAPWAGDTSGVRIGRVLNYAGLHAQSLDAGIGIMAPATSSDGTALDYIQSIADSESGVFYIDTSGNAVFKDRHYFIRPASKAMFGDDGLAELPYVSMVLDYSEDLIYNDVTTSDAGGNRVNVQNPDSIAKYLRRSYSKDLIVNDLEEARAAAQWLALNYADPAVRVRSMTVEPVDRSNVWNAILATDITDRITVVRRTPSGSVLDTDALIDGVNHSYDATSDAWSTTFALHAPPAGTFLVADDIGNDPMPTRVDMEETITCAVAVSGSTLLGTETVGQQVAVVNGDPITMPTSLGFASVPTSGAVSLSCGALVNVAPSGAPDLRPTFLASGDLGTWDPATYGRFDTFVVFQADGHGGWERDPTLSATADVLAASNSTHGLDTFPGSVNPGITAMTVLPQSGHVVFIETAPTIAVIDPTTSTLVGCHSLGGTTDTDDNLVNLTPRFIAADPSSALGDERFLVVFDADGDRPSPMAEFSYDAGNITQKSGMVTMLGAIKGFGPVTVLEDGTAILANHDAGECEIFLKLNDGERRIVSEEPASWHTILSDLPMPTDGQPSSIVVDQAARQVWCTSDAGVITTVAVDPLPTCDGVADFLEKGLLFSPLLLNSLGSTFASDAFLSFFGYDNCSIDWIDGSMRLTSTAATGAATAAVILTPAYLPSFGTVSALTMIHNATNPVISVTYLDAGFNPMIADSLAIAAPSPSTIALPGCLLDGVSYVVISLGATGLGIGDTMLIDAFYLYELPYTYAPKSTDLGATPVTGAYDTTTNHLVQPSAHSLLTSDNGSDISLGQVNEESLAY